MTHIKTLVFLDIETTDLLRIGKPLPDVTELHMCAVSREQYEEARPCYSGVPGLPRVRDYINLTIQPKSSIQSEAVDLTKLTEDALKTRRPFDNHVYLMVNSFLYRLERPICLIAHNGPNFDFVILREEFRRINKNFPSGLFYVDSCKVLQEVLRSTQAFKLCDLYKKFFGHDPDKQSEHTAQGDVHTLIRMSLARPADFVRSLEKRAQLLELPG